MMKRGQEDNNTNKDRKDPLAVNLSQLMHKQDQWLQNDKAVNRRGGSRSGSSEGRPTSSQATGHGGGLSPADELPSGTYFDARHPPRWQWHKYERLFWVLLGFVTYCYINKPVYDMTNTHGKVLRHTPGVRIHDPWRIFGALGSTGYDDSDFQLKVLLRHAPLIVVGFSAFCAISQLSRRFFGERVQTVLRLTMSIIFAVVLMGDTVLFSLIATLLNLLVIEAICSSRGKALLNSLRLSPKVFVFAIWIIQIAFLFLLDKLGSKNPYSFFFGKHLGKLIEDVWHYKILFGYSGLMPWTSSFNMSTLRMLAFNWDCVESSYYAEDARRTAVRRYDPRRCLESAVQLPEHQFLQLQQRSASNERSNGGGGEESPLTRGGVPSTADDFSMHDHPDPCYNFRSDYPHDVSSYGYNNYLMYMYYPPLYVAGPMCSFNAFVSYTRGKPMSHRMTFKELSQYAFTVLRFYLELQLYIHFIHFNAIRKEIGQSGGKSLLSPHLNTAALIALANVALTFLWLKFSFIWKLFRLFALLDGVEVPEDMKRCYASVYTIADFWRNWHSSFNIWILRYMYIPLGGSKTKVLSSWLIFGFIAIWHDIELHLLSWAFVMGGTLVVEGLALEYFGKSSRWDSWRKSPYSRVYRSIGTFVGTQFLVLANFVGFGGTGGSIDGNTGMVQKKDQHQQADNNKERSSSFLSSEQRDTLTILLVWCVWIIAASFMGVIVYQNHHHRTVMMKKRYGIEGR